MNNFRKIVVTRTTTTGIVVINVIVTTTISMIYVVLVVIERFNRSLSTFLLPFLVRFLVVIGALGSSLPALRRECFPIAGRFVDAPRADGSPGLY
jgi:hypothetical protein